MKLNHATNKSTDNVGKQVFAGLRWTGGTQVFQQFLNLAFSVVMARLLVPEDYGLLAMASVFTGVVFFVLDLGLSAAIVQRPDLKERQISSIFWINIAMGLIMTLLGIASSWPIARFYNSPGVQPLVIALSLNFLLFSMGATQGALLTRQMDFKTLQLRTLIAQIVSVTCAITLAFLGFGVWSLVSRILIAGLIEVILMWSVSTWSPTWSFAWADVKELSGFSSDVLTSNLLIYIGRNADNLLIGKFLGTTSLGYYAMAYNVMMLPVQRCSQMFVKVMFPALSRLKEDAEKFKRSWLRAIRLTGAVVVPLMLGLICLTPQFVQVIYGEPWLPVVPLLQLLAISGIVQTLAQLNRIVLLALGQTRLGLKLIFISVFITLVSFIVGLPYGVTGVALSFAVASTISETFFLFKTLECINVSYIQYFSSLNGVMVAAGGMSLAVLALVTNLPVNPATLLAIAVPFGGVVYLLLLRLFAPLALSEALNIMPKRFVQRWAKPS